MAGEPHRNPLGRVLHHTLQILDADSPGLIEEHPELAEATASARAALFRLIDEMEAVS